jgi:PTH1 family peptidyl-tRNA hydrolase
VKVIAGLGNPGKPYENSRHNFGFMVVDHLAERHGTTISTNKLGALIGKFALHTDQILLVKPQAFMNLSGRPIGELIDYFRIDHADAIVVHDDLDLEFGRIKIARQGGPGGHKGVGSIIQVLGTKSFTRVKVGIGRPRFGEQIEKYVLDRFYHDQQEHLEGILSRAAEALELILISGAAAAMNIFNPFNPKQNEEGTQV